MIIQPKLKPGPKKRPCLQAFYSGDREPNIIAATPTDAWKPRIGGSSLFNQAVAVEFPPEDDVEIESEELDDQGPKNDYITKVGLIINTQTGNDPPPAPRYMKQLVEVAKLREAEMETIHERQMMREILEQGSPIEDAFVTPGYRKRLAERAAAAQTMAQREASKAAQSLQDIHTKTIYAELARQPLKATSDQSLTESMIGKKPSEVPKRDLHPSQHEVALHSLEESDEELLEEKRDRQTILLNAKARYEQRKQQQIEQKSVGH